MTVTPYKDQQAGKKEQVQTMFNNIAHKYDFLNHFLSMGIDILWRKKAVAILKKEKPAQILDIATGTADFALEALALNPEKITGIDISEGMLEVGRKKIQKKNLQHKIELILADSENMPFDNEQFNAITVAFGVRNFENLLKGLKEMNRVLKLSGTAVVLEFSKPKKFPVKQIYNFYFFKILPFIGNLISKDNAAYTYLPESVGVFPDGKDFLLVMEAAGFRDVYQKSLMFGIASIYVGKK
jgi:demethylmenaquinone methyltransferase / 2-methoxy-6-polyprenyl-1,4-benzoquinol methylase